MDFLAPLFTIMSPAELCGTVASLAYVHYAVRNQIQAWPWGIAGSLFYGYVFLVSKLYSDAGLQLLYFLPMQFYGWWMWSRRGPEHSTLPISLLTPRARIGWALVIVALSVSLGYVMSTYTDASLPYADATAAAISIVAQYLQARRIFENWALWIGVDLFYVLYIYPIKQLYVTTGLYLLFTVMAVQGFHRWWQIYREEQQMPAQDMER